MHVTDIKKRTNTESTMVGVSRLPDSARPEKRRWILTAESVRTHTHTHTRAEQESDRDIERKRGGQQCEQDLYLNCN